MYFGDLSEDVDYDEEEISMNVMVMMMWRRISRMMMMMMLWRRRRISRMMVMMRRRRRLIPGAGNRRTPLLSRRSEL